MTPKSEPVEPKITRNATSSASRSTHKPPSDPDRQKALKAVTDFRRAIAWQLHRCPLEKYVVEERTRIHLPRTYLAKGGVEVKFVRAGSDLNQFVYEYYLQEVDLSVENGQHDNYVSADNVVARRHEYLGPDPRIAGYRFDSDGEVHVKWWDSFLCDQWMNAGKWKFEVELNDEGRWVEKDD